MIGSELAAALERAAIALESGDAVTAASATDRCRELCAQDRATGEPLAPGEATSLRALLARGQAAAARKVTELDRAKRRVASSRRAHTAYER